MELTLHVNGQACRVEADGWESLLFVLRERLGLYGAKNACEEGECGSCSVLIDDELVCACLVMAFQAQGSHIATVEGLEQESTTREIQRAMVECGAVQCGFCTPGFVVAIHDLLQHSPQPTEEQIREQLAGNLCRCTGYGKIIDAVNEVSARLADPS